MTKMHVQLTSQQENEHPGKSETEVGNLSVTHLDLCMEIPQHQQIIAINFISFSPYLFIS